MCSFLLQAWSIGLLSTMEAFSSTSTDNSNRPVAFPSDGQESLNFKLINLPLPVIKMSKFFILSFILELEQHRSAMPGTDLFPIFFLHFSLLYWHAIFLYSYCQSMCINMQTKTKIVQNSIHKLIKGKKIIVEKIQ